MNYTLALRCNTHAFHAPDLSTVNPPHTPHTHIAHLHEVHVGVDMQHMDSAPACYSPLTDIVISPKQPTCIRYTLAFVTPSTA